MSVVVHNSKYCSREIKAVIRPKNVALRHDSPPFSPLGASPFFPCRATCCCGTGVRPEQRELQQKQRRRWRWEQPQDTRRAPAIGFLTDPHCPSPRLNLRPSPPFDHSSTT